MNCQVAARALLPFALLSLAPNSVSAQEEAGNWCVGDPIQTGPPGRVWQVDTAFDSEDVWGDLVAASQIRWRLDEVLQTATRHSRHIAANRIWNANVSCGWGYAATQSCFRPSLIDDAVLDLSCYNQSSVSACTSQGNCPSGFQCVDSLCVVEAGPLAHANCNQNGACWVVMCADRPFAVTYGGVSQFNSATTTGMIRHELGHTWGLDHVSSHGTPSQCQITNNSCWNMSQSNPGPCDGELMCNAITTSVGVCTNKMSFQSGDTKGLRTLYPINPQSPDEAYASREIFKARFSAAGTTITSPAFAVLENRTSVFKPRIDCADSATAEKNDCVMVRAMSDGAGTQVQLRRMDNWAQNSWGTFSHILTVSTDATSEPDIAVNADASRAVVVFAGIDGHDHVNVLYANVDPGSPFYGNVTAAIKSIDSELPPRVAYIHALNQWVVAVATASGIRLFGLDPNSMLLYEVYANHADYPITESIGSDFDVDCKRSGYTASPPWTASSGTANTCTIVAPVRISTTLGNKVARYEFQASQVGVPLGPWDLWQNGYETGWVALNTPSGEVNGVASVAFTNGNEVVVDYSQSLSGGSDTSNSLIVRYSNIDLTATAQTPSPYKSDAETCQTTYDNQMSIPPVTPHGGSAVAYCSSCGTGGALEAVAWGRRSDSDPFCW